MVEFKNILASTKPRELSGQSSANRFQFQKSWSICKLLELYLLNEDFLILFDFHEDIVVLNSSENPSQAEFIQVKTKKNGNWTLSRLSKLDVKTNSSILSKLYGCYILFPDNTKSLLFLSNQYVKVKLDSGENSIDREIFNFKDLLDKDKAVISGEFLKTTIQNLSGLDFLNFQKTEMGINEHEIFVRGKLSDFLVKQFPDVDRFPINSIYLALCDEVRRKNDYEISVSDFKKLKEKKGVSKSDFENMLSIFKANSQEDTDLDDLCKQMRSESFQYSQIKTIQNFWGTYKVQLMDSENLVLPQLRDFIAVKYRRFVSSNPNYTLRNAFQFIRLEIDKVDKFKILDNEILSTAILFEVSKL